MLQTLMNIIDCHCKRRYRYDFQLNVVQFPGCSRGRKGVRSWPTIPDKYLFSFFMQSPIDMGSNWLILFCIPCVARSAYPLFQ